MGSMNLGYCQFQGSTQICPGSRLVSYCTASYAYLYLLFPTKIFPTQDLIVKVKEGEEEIKQLKKHLADYTVKVINFAYKGHLLCIFPFLSSIEHKQFLTGSPNTH